MPEQSKPNPTRTGNVDNAQCDNIDHLKYAPSNCDSSDVEVDFDDDTFIDISISAQITKALLDSGSWSNLIDSDFWESLDISRQIPVHPPRMKKACTANKSYLNIIGFVHIPIRIENSVFRVPMYIACNLNQRIILGKKFLKQYQAKIDYQSQKLRLYKKSQLRVIEKQEIPPHTQSVVRARVSNNLPNDTMGLCQSSRRANSLGVVVANCVSPIEPVANKRYSTTKLLVLNPTDEPIVLYPRTKIGSYTIVNHDEIFPFTDIDESVSEEVQVPVTSLSVDANCSSESKVCDEILSQINIQDSKLSGEESQKLTNLITEYADIFQTKEGPRGKYTKIEHVIRTGDHSPIKCRPYRQPPHVQAEIRKQVNQMLDDGLVRESTSSWSFPVVMIPKPDGSMRFCVNMKPLNNITEKDNFPLPHIDDALDSLGSANPKYFSTLDLATGYWQIGLEEESRKKSAFITQDGLYEFNVMPMGLTNAPATFQRVMQEVFRGLNWKFVLIYLDDIIVFSKSFQEHVEHLRQVFQRLRESNLKLKPKKCTFAREQVRYLGHIVSHDGIATDPEKTKIVQEYPVPTKVSELRSFLGFVGYYRKYIKDYCKIAEPLTNLTRKDVPYVWSNQCAEAFETLKQKLMEPPILAYPRFDGSEFILQTDASNKGLGFILAQIQDGHEKVICYGGRALHQSEKNYTTTELEALAVVEGIKKYSSYLRHVKFTVQTDHCALKWLFNQQCPSGRLTRWTMKLQSHTFVVVHKKGSKNSNADALSRIPSDMSENCKACKPVKKCNDSSVSSATDTDWQECDLSKVAVDVLQEQDTTAEPEVNVVRNLRYQRNRRIAGDETYVLNQKTPSLPTDVNMQMFEDAQLSDSFSGPMMKYLNEDVLPDNQKHARDILWQQDQYLIRDGLLYHVWHTPAKRHMPERNTLQLYVPITMIDTILNHCHDNVLAAHFGFHRTYLKVRERYFWKRMYRDIDNWVRSCESCARRKTHRHKVIAPMMTMKVPGPFERVSVDILGPLPITTNGNRYVLCFTDHCTRWPILVPIKTTDSATIARAFFEQVICQHGCPQYLLSDRGSNFLSKIVLEVCRIMQTSKLNTSSYHPQCNAVQERFNSVILDTLSHYANEYQTNWDEFIPAIQFAYRSTPADNSVGFSPFFLLYGREARLPLEVTLGQQMEYHEKTLRDHIHHLVSQLEVFRAVSKQHAEMNQAHMKQRYDENTKDVQYQVGDTVWLYIPATQPGLSKKLMKFWSGPYLLVEQTGPVNFRVRNLENNKLVSAPVHVNRMKFAYDRYTRPENHVMPRDFVQRDPLDDVVDADCPSDSFVPLMASQEADKAPPTAQRQSSIPTTNSDRMYVVEKVLRGRYRDNKLQYLIKWKNFPSSSNTWEPVENLNQATVDFLKQNPVKITGKVK